MRLEENVPLAGYTTFGIGGPARLMATVTSEPEVAEAVRLAAARGLPLLVLGGGSNLLVADAGFPGLVLHMALQGVVVERGARSSRFSAAAGESWDAFVELAAEEDSAGIECLAGIPGTVGGTPVQNVGAYGQEVAETIRLVRAYDRESGEFVELPGSGCRFRYRSSLFNTAARGRYIVTRVDYELVPGGRPRLAYADLKRSFAPDAAPTLREVTATVRRIRQGKGMLLVEGDPECRSAGSFFKNPVVPLARLEQLRERFPAVPSYPAGEQAGPGMVKLAAAWLVEQAGFSRGFAMGRARISSRHTLALVNSGGSTAAEILALRDAIREGVAARFGIELEPEPVYVG